MLARFSGQDIPICPGDRALEVRPNLLAPQVADHDRLPHGIQSMPEDVAASGRRSGGEAGNQA